MKNCSDLDFCDTTGKLEDRGKRLARAAIKRHPTFVNLGGSVL